MNDDDDDREKKTKEELVVMLLIDSPVNEKLELIPHIVRIYFHFINI